MAELKVDIRNGWRRSEGQRKKSGSVRWRTRRKRRRGRARKAKGGHFRLNLCNCDRPSSCSGKCNERRSTTQLGDSERMADCSSLVIESFGGFRVCNRTIRSCHVRVEGLFYPPNSKRLSQLVTCSFKTRPFNGDLQ